MVEYLWSEFWYHFEDVYIVRPVVHGKPRGPPGDRGSPQRPVPANNSLWPPRDGIQSPLPKSAARSPKAEIK